MKYIILGLGKSGKATLKWCHKNSLSAIVVDDSPDSALQWIQSESFPFCVYPNNLKNREFSDAECHRFDSEKSSPLLDIGADFSKSKMGHSAKEKTDSSGYLGIYSSDAFLTDNHVIDSSDICILSPGISKSHKVYSFLKDKVSIISEVELALRACKGRFPKMIAVTGTNGKTTVVMLLTHVLNTCGMRARAIGNIGTPVIEALMGESSLCPEWFVVELSSFQLEHVFSPAFSIGCWLNIAPNHLDWHSSMEEYVSAKGKLPFLVQKEGAFFLHESISYPMPSSLKVISYGRNTDTDLSVPKGVEAPHDIDNFLVVAKIAKTLGISLDAVKEAYKTFKKPNFRIECVGCIDGVTYINDSKSTNIASTEAALKACKAPIVLIAGGVHKGASYAPWKQFADKIISVVAIGQAKNLIKDDIGDSIPVVFASSLQEAVSLSSRICDFSGTVLLSPGCSSFDMFTDYTDRGRRFSEIVREKERETKKAYD